MKEGKAKLENKGLVVLLCVLLVAIVGLGIGIGITVLNSNRAGNVEAVLPEELMGDSLSPEDQVVKETSLMLQDPDVSEVDIEDYYDRVVEDAVSDGDTGLAVEIIIQKMNFLAVVENDCNKAEDYVNSIDLAIYSSEEVQYLASYAASMAGGCGNSELEAKWNEV